MRGIAVKAQVPVRAPVGRRQACGVLADGDGLVKTLDLVVEAPRALESGAGFVDVAALQTTGGGVERGAEVEEHRL
jgi:hypothetical protein